MHKNKVNIFDLNGNDSILFFQVIDKSDAEGRINSISSWSPFSDAREYFEWHRGKFCWSVLIVILQLICGEHRITLSVR